MMARTRSTTPRRRRQREFLATAAAIALAAVCGVTAAHFGTHRSWERAPATTATSSPAAPAGDSNP